MLDAYKDGQAVAYNIMMNAINNNKLSHAYLFDSNGNSDAMNIVLSFVKMIICMNKKYDEEILNICDRIDNGNYIDVKIIEPDGLWIKKEQLLDLQSEFSKSAIEGSKKIYIIKSADKMNIQTANSILKFLEEPVDDIIAILIVDNINLVIPTIISRCQIIKLNKKKYEESSLLNFSNLCNNTKYRCLSDDEKKQFIDDVINFIMMIENSGLDTLIYTKNIWHNKFKDRNDNIMAIELIINFYYDVMKFISNLKINFFKDKIEYIENVSKKNNLISVAKKIEILDEIKNNFKRNLNINLLIDKLIIDMCGDKNGNCWSKN
ncbi:MAG: hypothetical protein ACI4VL_03695 [Bacilli bacterium]